MKAKWFYNIVSLLLISLVAGCVSHFNYQQIPRESVKILIMKEPVVMDSTFFIEPINIEVPSGRYIPFRNRVNDGTRELEATLYRAPGLIIVGRQHVTGGLVVAPGTQKPVGFWYLYSNSYHWGNVAVKYWKSSRIKSELDYEWYPK